MHRPLSAIDTVVIHHADTPDGDGRFTISDIDNWHAEKNFRRDPELVDADRKAGRPARWHVGYQRVVHTDGQVALGRWLEEVGAHAVRYNGRSIGICLIGRDRFTIAQWNALKAQVEIWVRQFGKLTIVGHRDVNPDLSPICPGFDVAAWVHGGFLPLADHIVGP